LQFGACFILVFSSPNTLSTDMLLVILKLALMCKNNKTGQWLKKKSDIEQQHIVNDAVAKS
jgi:hypothetical protein